MKLIELHILQSFPVTCLNRDDVGAPKSAVFGGEPRARVSSQCWKRAIRTHAQTLQPSFFAGTRSRYVVDKLAEQFVKLGQPEAQARVLAEATADAVGKLDDRQAGNVKTLLFFSPQELQAVAANVLEEDVTEAVTALTNEQATKKQKDAAKKDIDKVAKKAAKGFANQVKDAADIAIFGRMVADDHSLTLEGAGMFSHALSTHRVSNEIDFFSAVDDLTPAERNDAGAGHIGTNEFNAACYYRYVGINCDLLADEDHLAHLADDERQQVLDSFLRAAIEAVPNARHNSMLGHNPPACVLGRVRQGQPISLANAFEKPVRSQGGYVGPSKEAMKQHHQRLTHVYGLDGHEVWLDTEDDNSPNIDTFIQGLLDHV